MDNDTPLPVQIIQSLETEVKEKLRLAGSIGHPGENGRARENIIANVIRRIIPQSFGVDTGFVIDGLGNISKQVDIVIYKTDFHPVFEIGGIKHFLVESVVAVIENKARISSLAQLKGALENLHSVKQLDRTNQGRNFVILGGQNGPPVDLGKFGHQIWGAIVTQKSLTPARLEGALLDFMRSHERRLWPNLYVDVYGPAVSYMRARQPTDSVSSEENEVVAGPDPTDAERLFTSSPDTPNYRPPLATLVQGLLNFLKITPLVDYRLTDYLWAQSDGIVSPLLQKPQSANE